MVQVIGLETQHVRVVERAPGPGRFLGRDDRRLRAKPALGLALEGSRGLPCHIALPEISETFGQSGHITHLLAGEAASHTAQVPGPGDRVKRSATATRSEARVGRDAARPKSMLFGMLRSAGPGICMGVMSTVGSSP
jgi:hypothetical protein